MESESVGTDHQNRTTDQADLKASSEAGQEEHTFTSDANSTKVGTEDPGTVPKSPNESTRSNCGSPEPSCAICLGPLQNKSFTDSCFHTFCFTCLLSWSKVKAECPLCKQKFKSIVHNVRSIEDYDQYYIVARSSESSWSTDGRRRFRYSSTVTAERVLERRRQVAEDLNQTEYQMHRSMFAPHTVTTYHTTNTTTVEAEDTPAIQFRRRIYTADMWVRAHMGNTKVRDTSPNFYFHNLACTHRLMPWLNRELVAILSHRDSRIVFLMDLILSLIMRFDIRSQEFFLHLQGYLGERTRHFVHEFYSFASSPYDMEQYDVVMNYDYVINAEDPIVISSPDCDTETAPIPLSFSAAASACCSSILGAIRKKESRKHRSKLITKLYLKKNQDTDSWDVFSPSSRSESRNAIDNYVPVLDMSIPGPSSSFTRSSVIQEAPPAKAMTPVDLTTINDETTDDECMVVGVMKPRNERDHEIIELSSGSEDVVPNAKNVDNEQPSLSSTGGLNLLFQASEIVQALSSVPAEESIVSFGSKKTPKSSKLKSKKHTSKKRCARKPRTYVYSSSDTDEYVPEKYSPSVEKTPFQLKPSDSSQNQEPGKWYSDTTDIDVDSCDEKTSGRVKIRSIVGNVNMECHKTHSDSHSKKHKHKKKSKHVRHKHHKRRSSSKDN